MRVPRLTIATLMVGIALFGLTIALLRNADERLAQAFLTMTIVLIVAMAGCAAMIRGRGGAVWLVFAVVAGSYLLVCFGIARGPAQRAWLPTSKALKWAFPYLAPPVPMEVQPMRIGPATPRPQLYAVSVKDPSGQRHMVIMDQKGVNGLTKQSFIAMFGNYASFERIGHCLLALLLGGNAMAIPLYLFARRDARKARAGEGSPA